MLTLHACRSMEVKLHRDSELPPVSSNVPASSVITPRLFSKPQAHTTAHSGAFLLPCYTEHSVLSLVSDVELPLHVNHVTSKAPEVEFNVCPLVTPYCLTCWCVSFSRIRPKPFEGKSLPETFLLCPLHPLSPPSHLLSPLRGMYFFTPWGPPALPQGNFWFSCLVKAR